MTKEEMEIIVDQCKYRNWVFAVMKDTHGSLYLQAEIEYDQRSRKWLLSEHMTKSEIVQTVFKLVMTAEEHEIREAFKYDDESIFQPHWNVDVLAALRRTTKADKRKEIA